MSHIDFKASDESVKYKKATGAGTSGDPFVELNSDGIAISQTPTITAGAYSAGDAVGELLTFADAVRESGGLGEIKSVVLFDKNLDVHADLRLWLFDSAPTAVGDNAPFDISDADMAAKCVGFIDISASDYGNALDNAVAFVPAPGLRFHCDGTALYGQLALQTSSAPTYNATDDLTITLEIEYKS